MHCYLFVNCQMVEEQKALILQKYARAWLARRRFQTMRRLVLNVQLSFRVQQLRKKIEEQVNMLPRLHQLWLLCRGRNWIPVSLQNKENRGLMERLTSLANSHSQTVDRLQGLEAQLEKSTNQKASLEAREKKAKEDASLVSFEVDSIQLFASLQLFVCLWSTLKKKNIFILLSDNCTASKGNRCTELSKAELGEQVWSFHQRGQR